MHELVTTDNVCKNSLPFSFMVVEVFPFAHHSESSMKFSLKSLSFEEIGSTVVTRRIPSLLFLTIK